MGEIQIEQSSVHVLERLSDFDVELENRITAVVAGLSPNGENPNGILNQAINGGNPEAHKVFTDEYNWALSLAIYPHRLKEERSVLMSAATDGLYIAGETYDPTTEPNFLKHMSETVGSYLREVFGETDPGMYSLPAADEFESFVLAKQSPEDSLLPPPRKADPPLADALKTTSIQPTAQPIESYTPNVSSISEPKINQATHTRTEPASVAAEYLERMSPYRRMAAYRAGKLTRHQLSIWAGRFPHEVPIINGEFEWIARSLADLD